MSAAATNGQSKRITPDPYFSGGESTSSPIKKSAELAGGWKAPLNLGIGSGSANSNHDSAATTTGNDFNFKPASVGTISKPQESPQFAGLNSGSIEKTAQTPTSDTLPFAADSQVRTANVGSQTRNLTEPSPKPAKSLIVHAHEQQNSFNSGSGSRSSVRQVDHEAAPVTKAFRPGKVLALVGGEPIFVGDLMFQINQLIETKMAGAPEKVKEQQRQIAIPQLLPQIVESKLLYQGALRSLPDDVDMEGIFSQVEKQFEDTEMKKMMESAGVKSTAEFDARLRGQEYSLRQLKRNWAIQQFTRHSIGQIIGDVPPATHQEMLDRYKEKIASYEKPARAKWEEILIRFDRTGSRAETKRAIVEIGNQIVHGANFAATAKKQSHGFNAASGGVHDWTTQGALALDEIDKAIFSLPVGELSDLIETQRGFHIVRVVERTDANRTPFLEAQVDIKKKIAGEKRKAAFDKYIKKLREEIPVEYLVNE